MNLHLRLVWELAWRELRGRYAGSAAGRAWLLLQPLALIAIYALVFSRLVQVRAGGEDGPYSYVIYLCSGLLPWICLENTLKAAGQSFFSQAGLLKKTPFPVALPVLSTVLAQHLVMLAGLGALLIFLAAVGRLPGPSFLCYPLLFLLQLVLLSGTALLLAPLSALWRDVPEAVGTALALFFWLTPIAYPEQVLPPLARQLLQWNPALRLVRLHHRLLWERDWPAAADWLALAAAAAAALLVGVWFCRRTGREALDQI